MNNFDPTSIFEDLKQDSTSSYALELVDESNFPKAPNLMEFVTSPEFLNTTILPKQVEMGAKLFADYCPDCSRPGFIDQLYDESPGKIKANITFLEHGVCPKCQQTRYELVKAGKLNLYNEYVGCMGQRSGKTKYNGLICTYNLHKMVKLPNPIKKFGLTSGDLIMGTFAALTVEHAKDTIWDAFAGFIEGSPWYQRYHDFLKKEGKALGIELFKSNTTMYKYSHKHVLVHCTGSQDRKMRGKTRFMGSIDELGWFISDEGKKHLQNMNADAVYTALANSLSTMRMKLQKVWGPKEFDLPLMLMSNISSPSAAKDKIMRLYKAAKSNPKMCSFKLPTWEANPDYTEESLRNEYSSMPELEFTRDFGAEPPLTSEPYISDPKVIDKICTEEPTPYFVHQMVKFKETDNSYYKSCNLIDPVGDKHIPRMVTFDLGFRKNALAVCIFRLDGQGKPLMEFALQLVPEKNVPVNVAHFFDNFTLPLVTRYNIKYAFFDRWQSLDQIQRLKSLKVHADTYSLTYKDMDNVRGLLTSASALLPKIPKPMTEVVQEYKDNEVFNVDPITMLGMQILTVRDLGHAIKKPLVGDDDIFRAYCLGITKIQEPTIAKRMSQVVQTKSGHKVAPIAGMVRTKGRVLKKPVVNSSFGALRRRTAG